MSSGNHSGKRKFGGQPKCPTRPKPPPKTSQFSKPQQSKHHKDYYVIKPAAPLAFLNRVYDNEVTLQAAWALFFGNTSKAPYMICSTWAKAVEQARECGCTQHEIYFVNPVTAVTPFALRKALFTALGVAGSTSDPRGRISDDYLTCGLPFSEHLIYPPHSPKLLELELLSAYLLMQLQSAESNNIIIVGPLLKRLIQPEFTPVKFSMFPTDDEKKRSNPNWKEPDADVRNHVLEMTFVLFSRMGEFPQLAEAAKGLLDRNTEFKRALVTLYEAVTSVIEKMGRSSKLISYSQTAGNNRLRSNGTYNQNQVTTTEFLSKTLRVPSSLLSGLPYASVSHYLSVGEDDGPQGAKTSELGATDKQRLITKMTVYEDAFPQENVQEKLTPLFLKELDRLQEIEEFVRRCKSNETPSYWSQLPLQAKKPKLGEEPQLSGNDSQPSSGAAQPSSGAAQLSSGASQPSSGASQPGGAGQ